MPFPDQINDVVNKAADHRVDGEARLQFLLNKHAELDRFFQPGLREYPTTGPVAKFYRIQRSCLTLALTEECQQRFLQLNRGKMPAWNFLLESSKYTDGSDPDHKAAQIAHAWGGAEKSVKEGMPEWFTILFLNHDLGKILLSFDEPDYRVVGDTFPHGVAPSPKEIYYEVFGDNPDARKKWFRSDVGLYDAGCGLDMLAMSWGHDEYVFHIFLNWFAENAEYVRENWNTSAQELRIFLYCLRFHSFYAFHREGAYEKLWSGEDRQLRPFLQLFSGFDLYTKVDKLPGQSELTARFKPLVERFLPENRPLSL